MLHIDGVQWRRYTFILGVVNEDQEKCMGGTQLLISVLYIFQKYWGFS